MVRPSNHRTTAGFSLVELVVVISVAIVMTALLMPAMRQVQENAHRVVCMSHLQQIGQGVIMYAHNVGSMPFSNALRSTGNPQDLMASKLSGPDAESWDGLGRLYVEGYCDAPECYYCPSHHGDHPYERYADRWANPTPGQPIYMNYHYAGDIEWGTSMRRNIDDGAQVVIATDGLRTYKDFNHQTGMNVLRADGSVRWRDDTFNIRASLPRTEYETPASAYQGIWELVAAQP